MVDTIKRDLGASSDFRILRTPFLGCTAEDVRKVAETVGQSRIQGFIIDEGNEFVYENVAKWLIGDETMKCLDPKNGNIIPGNICKGLYIGGKAGTGKTVVMDIMAWIADKVWNISYKAHGKTVRLTWIDSTFRADAIAANFQKNGEIDKYIEFPILCIQDLGVEPAGVSYMGTKVDVLRQILETRGDNPLCFTLITSNMPILSREDLKARYGERAVSRIVGMCNYFMLAGGDRRK